LITIIDTPHYPLRVRESKFKSGLIGAFLGGFFTVAFFGVQAFLENLNQQAKELEA